MATHSRPARLPRSFCAWPPSHPAKIWTNSWGGFFSGLSPIAIRLASRRRADHIFPKLSQLLPVNVIAHYFVFAFNPSSTSWRIASERPLTLLASAQVSTAPINSSDIRIPRVGSFPVAGLPDPGLLPPHPGLGFLFFMIPLLAPRLVRNRVAAMVVGAVDQNAANGLFAHVAEGDFDGSFHVAAASPPRRAMIKFQINANRWSGGVAR